MKLLACKFKEKKFFLRSQLYAQAYVRIWTLRPCSLSFLFSVIILHAATLGWVVLGTAYSDLYREGSPGKGTYFRRQVYTRVGISLVEVYKRIGKSVILVCKRTWKYQQTHFRAVKKPRKLHGLVVYSNLTRHNSWRGCSVLNLVQWNLYSTDTSFQRTKNLVPEKCSHCLCIATSIEGSWGHLCSG